MTHRYTALRATAIAALAALAITGCSRSETATTDEVTDTSDATTVATTAAPTTAPPTTAAPTTAPPTTAAPTTAPPTTAAPTTAPPTTAPPTTTAAVLTVADLTLATNGILPITFGTDAPTAVARLSEALGPVERDDVALYPNDTGDAYLDDFEETEYTWPIGRTVCWLTVCAEFGGTTTDNLQMTGWSYSAGGTPGLTTADGLTIGSTQAAFPTMNVGEGGCYWVGYGDMNGIELTLQSMDEPFVYVDDDGLWITQVPDPADVEVIRMEAGDLPIFLFADC